MNRPTRDAAWNNAAWPPSSRVLDRRAVLAGLGVLMLSGCASAPRTPSSAGAKSAPSAKSAGQSSSAAAAAGRSGTAAAASGRTDAQPKTVDEFIAQEPVRVPFNK